MLFSRSTWLPASLGFLKHRVQETQLTDFLICGLRKLRWNTAQTASLPSAATLAGTKLARGTWLPRLPNSLSIKHKKVKPTCRDAIAVVA